MSDNKNKAIAQKILPLVGDSGNITRVYNCMTRVRVDVSDLTDVDVESLKEIEGVLGVVEDGHTIQIVVGPGTAEKVANELAHIQGLDHADAIDVEIEEDLTTDAHSQAAANKEQFKKTHTKDSAFKRSLRAIASIFVPLIPAFVGAGIIGGIASVLQNLITAGTVSPETWGEILTVLNIIKNGLFGYLNIYIGINAAKIFGATEGLGGIIGGIVYLTGMDPENPLTNIFTGDPLAGGQGGVIGVVFAVWLLALLEKQLKKVVPDAIDIIVTPTVSLLVIGLSTIFIIMPLAGVISGSLVGTMNWVLDVGGPFAGFVLGATFLPLVMFGLHQILTPVHIEMINSLGQTNLLPILAMAGAGQVGAALAIWVKARQNKKLSTIIKGSLPVGILGIGEPLIYAVTLPLGRPFITACLGGGIGGAVIGAFGNVGATAIGPSGVALIPLIANGMWYAYVLGLLAAYVGGFILTYLFGVPESAMEETEV